jgi:hypothetical protein
MGITLGSIKAAIKDFLYIEDDRFLDVNLAVALSRKQDRCKLWLFNIGRSGDGKSEFMKLMETKDAVLIQEISSNTLINGKHDKKRYPDLAPRLKDKLVVIPEMATMLNLHQEERRKVWAQFRCLYDGKMARHSGDNMEAYYDNLNVTLIACSTPAIDNHILHNQDLGTRELIYRTEDKDEQKLMERVYNNTNIDKAVVRKILKDQVAKVPGDDRVQEHRVVRACSGRD